MLALRPDLIEKQNVEIRIVSGGYVCVLLINNL